MPRSSNWHVTFELLDASYPQTIDHSSMKPILLSCFGLAAIAAQAQCPFVPTIAPVDPILCPGGSTVLTTQDYDAYQWYQDGQAIPGATGPGFTVNYFDHAGFSFTVEATLDGCTTTSASVLVDGWVFLPPFVITDGDEPLFFGPLGEPTYCEGAFVQLTLGMPYTESIQWTLDGMPIPGANSPSLVVTAPGSYSVSGAPAICPNSVSNLGLTIDVAFQPPTVPVIQLVDDQLCASPAGNTYQWYLDGVALLGTNTPCITPSASGLYTVFVDYGQGCQELSAPFLSTGLLARSLERPWSLYPNPAQGLVTVAWGGSLPLGTYWSVTDAAGREVRGGFMPVEGPLVMDLADLPKGTYFFQAAHQRKALAPASPFTLVH